jgi:hypothetical protein
MDNVLEWRRLSADATRTLSKLLWAGTSGISPKCPSMAAVASAAPGGR